MEAPQTGNESGRRDRAPQCPGLSPPPPFGLKGPKSYTQSRADRSFVLGDGGGSCGSGGPVSVRFRGFVPRGQGDETSGPYGRGSSSLGSCVLGRDSNPTRATPMWELRGVTV